MEVRQFSPPDGLTVRECAAYRLGMIDMVLATVDDELLSCSLSAVLVDAFRAEQTFRREQLARGPFEDTDDDVMRDVHEALALSGE